MKYKKTKREIKMKYKKNKVENRLSIENAEV